MEEEKQENKRSYIHIEFEGINSTNRNLVLENVDPYQVFSIIEELRMLAQNGVAQQMQQQAAVQAQQAILIPKPKLVL